MKFKVIDVFWHQQINARKYCKTLIENTTFMALESCMGSNLHNPVSLGILEANAPASGLRLQWNIKCISIVL